MTTQRVPQRGQHGRFGSGPERILLLILIVLLVIVVGLLAWQIRDAFLAPAVPTPVPRADLPGAATAEPQLQITPGVGVAGTLITVWGQGWQPNDQLIVCLDDLGDDAEPPVYAETVVNTAGEFYATFIFPTDVQWRSLPDIPVVVESKTSHEKQAALFKLVAASPAPVATAVPPTAVQPTLTPLPATATPACRYSMHFVADITIPDDTLIPAGAGFIKTWRIGNDGTCAWPAGTSLIFAGGSQLSGPNAGPVPVTNPGETADVSVYLVAPATPGGYTGYWTLRLPAGAILSQRIFVRIVVPAPTPTPTPILPTNTPVPPTPTPVIFNWRGEYFNNPTLTGMPTLVRNDTAVNFNWGSGAPAAGLPSDNFSARWTRTLSLAEGSYRFHAAMDDGLRLYVDNTLLINEWRDASYREVSAELWLAGGSHEFRVEYYERLGQAQAQVWWESIAGFSNWRGEYWANKNLSGAPALVRNDVKIDFDWGFAAPAPGLPEEQFSARWTRIIAFEPGTYRLSARADDGVRVYVDGQRVIDQWRLSSGDHTYQKEISLQGTHTIVVEYYEEHIAAEVHFWYERLGN